MATVTPIRGDSLAGGPDSLYANDIAAFARRYFPAQCALPFSELHHHLIDRRQKKLAEPIDTRRGEIDVVLAPRGAAKSTLVSLIFPLHALIYGHEPYIVIISSTQQMAERRIANLRRALEQFTDLSSIDSDSDSFHNSYFKLHPLKATSRSIEFNNGRIESHSANTEIRGLLHGPWRPTWIILDDVERGDRVRSERQRERMADWFAEVIENLGAGYTHIDLIGTLLHPDALPARLLNRAETVGRKFVSIISESNAPDLWDHWRRIYHDLADPDRAKNARAFYELNKTEMDDGAQVLWEAREDYYDLCVLRERIGRSAFEKEKQNAPQFAAAGVFRSEKLVWFERENDTIKIDHPGRPDAPPCDVGSLRKFAYLDPAMGNAEGDYASVVVVGLDKDGYLYVLDAWLSKATPSEQVTRIFDLHAHWNFERFGIETNSFQKMYLEPLEVERERRRRAGLRHDLSVEERRSHRGKNDRILALEPLIDNGRLLLDRDLDGQLLSQLEDFPQGRHDDGPDALAGAVELAKKFADNLFPMKRMIRKPRGTPANY